MARCDPSPERVDGAGRAYKGSMLQLQTYVNRRVETLNDAIAGAVPGIRGWPDITWVSPIERDGFREYYDGSFIASLGLGTREADLLSGFWPRNARVDLLQPDRGG
jgi:hypothetical protein